MTTNCENIFNLYNKSRVNILIYAWYFFLKKKVCIYIGKRPTSQYKIYQRIWSHHPGKTLHVAREHTNECSLTEKKYHCLNMYWHHIKVWLHALRGWPGGDRYSHIFQVEVKFHTLSKEGNLRLSIKQEKLWPRHSTCRNLSYISRLTAKCRFRHRLCFQQVAHTLTGWGPFSHPRAGATTCSQNHTCR